MAITPPLMVWYRPGSTAVTGCHPGAPGSTRAGFTLLELLIVVLIIGILAAIAIGFYGQARERALQSADASNLHAVGIALMTYHTEYDTLPPADREAGPFMSHTPEFTEIGNGPAAGGSWDGLPWLLIELGYLTDPDTMFCPKYRKIYAEGETLRGGWPRYHNFRYAYNSSALSSGGHAGGSGIMTGRVWMVRDLYLPAQSGWYGSSYPNYPADYRFPWGEGAWDDQLELCFFADMGVHEVIGGTDQRPPE